MSGADRIRKVFALVQQKHPGIADLFAADAVIVYGRNARAEGRESIREFYRRAIEDMSPQPEVRLVLEAPPLYVAVIDVRTTSDSYRALDLFEVDEVGIRRLEIYSQA